MANNKTKIDSLHDLLPDHLNTKTNTNWKAIIEAIGGADQSTANLVAEVRKQFFVKTASRPYLDRLAANNKVARPKLVGMDDPSFREYIPVLSYKPKQVKLIVDQLLDIFFFKESTTAFITSQSAEPFNIDDGWSLEYRVDNINDERIVFTASEFTDISNATAEEVVASINRQTKYSYATQYYDSITKLTYIRIFSNTVGSKGSLEITGGRANISFRFNGFIDDAGNANNTEWTISKIGDETFMRHTNGNSPGLNKVQIGDILISNIDGNSGSFKIKSIDLATNTISFTNLFSTAGVYIQTSESDIKFIRPNKYVAHLNPRRAMTWETAPGEIVVEMPTSPPVVKRFLKGSLHINGTFSYMSSKVSDSSLTVTDATQFPNGGTFLIEPVSEIKTKVQTISENVVLSKKTNGRLIARTQRYTFTDRVAFSTNGSCVQGERSITLVDPSGVSHGQEILMDGVPTYAKVTSISGNIINISHPAESTSSNVSVSFLGNTLNGISPALPKTASLNEYTLSGLYRNNNKVTATVSGGSHVLEVGDIVVLTGASGINILSTTGNRTNGSNILNITGTMTGLSPGQIVTGSGIPQNTTVLDIIGSNVVISNSSTMNASGPLNFNENLNGSFTVTETSSNTFSFSLVGINGVSSPAGTAKVEKMELADSGSKIIIHNSAKNTTTRITGPYIWDPAAPFTLSSSTANINIDIQAGKIVRLLDVSDNDITNSGGFLVFDYGLETQEGPVRYLYKPTDTTIAIDPSYVFKYNHDKDSAIVEIRTNSPHPMSNNGAEYAPYITDPSEARVILQELIKEVKSAGIFVNFLVRYPEQLYSLFDIYNQQGKGAGEPFEQ